MQQLLLLLLITLTPSLAAQTCPQASRCIKLLQAGQICPLFPMIPGSFDPPLGNDPFRLTKLRPGVFHYSDDAYHALLVYSSKSRRLVVIDFPRSQNSVTSNGTYLLTTATQQILNGETPERVEMVYSHRHFDHIGSAGIYKKYVESSFPEAKISVWGTSETRTFIKRHQATDVPIPTMKIGDRRRTITLERNLRIFLSILGGHTSSDVLAYIPRSRDGKGVIHFVDVVTAGEAPFIQFTLTTDLGRYLTVHKRLLKLDFEYFSTGHGMLGDKNDVKTNMAYTEFVIEAARQGAREADPAKVGALFGRIANPGDVAYRNGAWALKSVLDLQIEICTSKVIRRWGCELSVVDVFAEGHCLAAVVFNFLEQ